MQAAAKKIRVYWVSTERDLITQEMFTVLSKSHAFPLTQFPGTVFIEAQDTLVRRGELLPNRIREYLSIDERKEWKKDLNALGNKYNSEIYSGVRTPKGVLVDVSVLAKPSRPFEQLLTGDQLEAKRVEFAAMAKELAPPIPVVNSAASFGRFAPFEKYAPPAEKKITPMEMIQEGLRRLTEDYVHRTVVEQMKTQVDDLKQIVSEQTDAIRQLVEIVTTPQVTPPSPPTQSFSSTPVHEPIVQKAQKKPKIAIVGVYSNWHCHLKNLSDHFDVRFYTGDERPMSFHGCSNVFFMCNYSSHKSYHAAKEDAKRQGVVVVHVNGGITGLRNEILKCFPEIS